MNREKHRICGETSNEAAAASEGVDYITRIPHKVVHRILSFLPFQYYIVLGMVKKDWNELLADAPVLHLDEDEIVSKTTGKLYTEICQLNPHLEKRILGGFIVRVSKRRFSDLVNRVISSHHYGVKIKHMCLSFQYEVGSENVCFIDSWIRFMMTRDIEKLELNFLQASSRYKYSMDFELPHRTFEPKFTSFALKFCKLKASRFVSFANLKVLHLSDVKVQDNYIGRLLSKCRILEDLKMERCSVTNNFFVWKQDLNIKHLKLVNCETYELRGESYKKLPVFEIDISVPQLVVLDFEGIHLMTSTIRNAPNLTDCSIDMAVHFTQQSQGNYLGSFMTSLQHCRNLSLNSWCIQVIPTIDYGLNQRLEGSFTNLTKLTLKLGGLKQELPGIIVLLHICPVLESLILQFYNHARDIEFGDEMLPDVFNFEEDEYLKNQTRVIPCLQNKLKDLHIYWFTGQNHAMNMIEFLLQKALVLENLVICKDWSLSGLQEQIISLLELPVQSPVQKLLSLPRGSSNVHVSRRNVEYPYY